MLSHSSQFHRCRITVSCCFVLSCPLLLAESVREHVVVLSITHSIFKTGRFPLDKPEKDVVLETILKTL